ncbi:MAG: hypothetical protein RLZZ76_449 [Candidatus Parcubacteria bacterium]|jgi:Icc-related predicted phosphoesterase
MEKIKQNSFNAIKAVTFATALAHLAFMEDARGQESLGLHIAPNEKLSATERAAIFTNLGLGDIEKLVDTIEIVSVSTNDKYILQIDQTHYNSLSPTKTPIKIAEAQREIGDVLKYIIDKNPAVKICPESLVSIDEYTEEIKIIQNLSEELTKEQNIDLGYSYFKQWNKLNYETYIAPYAEKMQMLGANTFSQKYNTEMRPDISNMLKKINPLGTNVEYAFGSIQKLYQDEIISKENILPCESPELLEKVSQIMLDGFSDIQGYDTAQDARESAISNSLNNYLVSTDKNDKYVVLVIGAKHNMTENLSLENTKLHSGTGYIRMRTVSTEEVIKDTEILIRSLNETDE